MEDKIIYPMTLDYVKSWGAWEVVRELVTNAIDASPDKKFVLQKASDEAFPGVEWLQVLSVGGYLEKSSFLFGVTQKENPETAIGKFGEGMKLAILVCSRFGKRIDVYSRKDSPMGDHYWNEIGELYGEKVLVIRHREENLANTLQVNSVFVNVHPWEHEIFEERFLTDGDPRILYKDNNGRYLVEESDTAFYVRGVWVQPAEYANDKCRFSYNMIDDSLNRDRTLIESWRAQGEIGNVWATIEDDKLIRKFWQAVKDSAAERWTYLNYGQVKRPDLYRQTFYEVFGSNSIIETEPEFAREASYRGANVISKHTFGQGLRPLVEVLMGTDRDFVLGAASQEITFVEEHTLTNREKGALSLLRRLAGRMPGFCNTIKPCLFQDRSLGAYKDGELLISVRALDLELHSIATWIHEEAHRQKGTADGTAAHAEAISLVGASVILSYARRGGK